MRCKTFRIHEEGCQGRGLRCSPWAQGLAVISRLWKPIVAFEELPLPQSEGGRPQGLSIPGEEGLCLEAYRDPLGSSEGQPRGLPEGGGV